MTNSPRADEFLQLFNDVAKTLYNRTSKRYQGSDFSSQDHIAFGNVVREAEERRIIPPVARELLMEWANFRNVMVHHHQYPRRVIADPTEQTLEEFRKLRNSIVEPKTVEAVAAKGVIPRDPEEKLSSILVYMRENRYSQVVVMTNEGAKLLSTEGVTRWLETSIDDQHVIAEQDTTVLDALEYEPYGSYRLMARTEPAFRAQEHFAGPPAEKDESRLFAVIVTQNGKANEKPIGIVTPWDLIGFDPLSNQ